LEHENKKLQVELSAVRRTHGEQEQEDELELIRKRLDAIERRLEEMGTEEGPDNGDRLPPVRNPTTDRIPGTRTDIDTLGKIV
jgi:hypothetical protein